ncbi:MAG: phosphoribosylglycinamide formyltransferase [Candidatus Margulisbacteria bacterium]|nr:phosphoribosylglycinamide formyltransferase [Candidatus Margulisiibacteriota bacterium]
MKIGVLISGRGSNLEAILNAISSGELNATIEVVISNNMHAPGLHVAREHGVPKILTLDALAYASPQEYETHIIEELKSDGVQLLVLAGYMKIVGPTLLSAFKDHMMNIHPSLLPSFKGLNAQKQALEAGVKVSGCTVHFVTDDLDGGPIILQQAVLVSDDDTESSLSHRILLSEQDIYKKAIQLYSEKRLVIDGQFVRILPEGGMS